jgi:hypothetical protein
MKNKRSARLGFAAAIWLVLSVAVFGTLIGIAWMSMNTKADVSADVVIDDSVDDDTTAMDPIFNRIDRDYWSTPTESIIVHSRDKPYFPTPYELVGPGQNPIVVGHLRDC